MSPPPPSRFELHVERWKDGCGAIICDGVRNRVYARGKIPCDVFFCGEAPGESEDVIGIPFCGPAGKLLDHIVSRAIPADSGVRCLFSNMVCCIPREVIREYDEETYNRPEVNEMISAIPVRGKQAAHSSKVTFGSKVSEPDHDDVLCCMDRLVELVEIAEPKVIICVGAFARDYFDTKYKHSVQVDRSIPRIDIIHPAAVIRANVAQRGLAVQRAVVTVQNAVEEYVLGENI